ncbi:MAG: HAD-IA family hydrolase [Blautia sp.]|nr:HAD-IA family hydrolase [Blautia sp.]
MRKESESSLRLEKGILLREYTYRELAEQIYMRLSFYEGFNASFPEFYKIALELELFLERKYGYVDKEIEEAIAFFRARNVRLAVVSDFYLNKEELASLLKKFGIDQFDLIFVSSDFGKAKYSGELYEEILKELKTDPAHILMIGDNRKADFISAKSKGIRAYYKKWNDCLKVNDRRKIQKDLARLAKRKKRYAYENYAFVLYCFIDKLYKKLKADEIQEVLFLAREGEMLKRLFDIYLRIKEETDIKTYYFYTSRIASYAAGLKPIKEEKFGGLFRRRKDLSILVFLKSIGWEEGEIKQLEDCIGDDINRKIPGFPDSPEFQELKGNTTFLRIYDKHRSEQNQLMLKYIEQSGVDYHRGLNIVDVGWRGSIQDNLFRCFDGKINIHGYYIGVSKLWTNSKENLKEGLIFSEYPCKSENFEIWNFDKFMFERILIADHPTTNGYKETEGSVIPVLKSYIDESEAYRYISSWQEAVTILFSDIAGIFADTVYRPDDFRDLFAKIHLRMLCKIGTKEIRMQKKLYHYNYESFGDFGLTKVNYLKEIRSSFSKHKIPVRKIIKNGVNFAYIQSISITTYCVAHGMEWVLPILYRILYIGELKKICVKR